MGMFIAIVLAKEQNVNQAISSINGSVIQMISHGLISAGLFFSIGVLYNRKILTEDLNGIIHLMPTFAKLFMLFCLANIALPGTIGFVGELLIILASFKFNWQVAAILATGLLLSASYTLWMYKKTVFDGPGFNITAYHQLRSDLNYKETLVLTSGAILILLFGIWPAPIFNILNNSTLALIKVIS